MNKLKSVGLKSGAAALGHAVWAAAVALAGAVALAPAAQAQAPAPAAVAQAKPVKLALIESLSGPFANTGEAVYRNIYWAMERVNARGGVQLPASSGWQGHTTAGIHTFHGPVHVAKHRLACVGKGA